MVGEVLMSVVRGHGFCAMTAVVDVERTCAWLGLLYGGPYFSLKPGAFARPLPVFYCLQEVQEQQQDGGRLQAALGWAAACSGGAAGAGVAAGAARMSVDGEEGEVEEGEAMQG
jgi:hypothetical protein